ncbi:MAG: GNAT family N-acetyltransferase [Proteobacteria bacterium]|nr:GNAT family N-acetyltransferase [Pseudomonadota bacterium]
MSAPAIRLRPYCAADEGAAIELWRRAWQVAYPAIDFSARLSWWRAYWRDNLAGAHVVLAERDGELVGLVTVDARGCIDQLLAAPECWGAGVAAMLMGAAKERAPAGLHLEVNCDNIRAERFYRKHGFSVVGEGRNPRSGAATWRMRWPPDQVPAN